MSGSINNGHCYYNHMAFPQPRPEWVARSFVTVPALRYINSITPPPLPDLPHPPFLLPPLPLPPLGHRFPVQTHLPVFLCIPPRALGCFSPPPFRLGDAALAVPVVEVDFLDLGRGGHVVASNVADEGGTAVFADDDVGVAAAVDVGEVKAHDELDEGFVGATFVPHQWWVHRILPGCRWLCFQHVLSTVFYCTGDLDAFACKAGIVTSYLTGGGIAGYCIALCSCAGSAKVTAAERSRSIPWACIQDDGRRTSRSRYLQIARCDVDRTHVRGSAHRLWEPASELGLIWRIRHQCTHRYRHDRKSSRRP